MNRTWPLLLAGLLSLPACDDGGDSNDTGGNNSRVDTILALTPDATAGQTVFTETCGLASCHGADGNTPGTPSTKKLTDEIMELSDSAVVTVIIDGKDSMPAQSLSDQQVADVLAYVNETFG